MKLRLRHLPEKADQCLGCACENEENLAARELLIMTDSLSVRGVVAAIFMAGTTGQSEIVSLAREAISEQREWCDRNGAFKPGLCTRYAPALPMGGGESPMARIADDAE